MSMYDAVSKEAEIQLAEENERKAKCLEVIKAKYVQEAMANILPRAREAFAKLKSLEEAITYALGTCKENGDRAADLVPIYARVRIALDNLAEKTKDLGGKQSLLADVLIPEAFEREQISTLTTSERDRVTITQKLFASIAADKRAEAYKWLRENGYGDLITETVNSSTLSAWAKAEAAENRELPENLFTTHQKASTSLTLNKKAER